MRHDSGHWAEFNSRQGGRPARELCRKVMTLAGPGAGRFAVDLGCGAGVETRALLDAGWHVLAHDSEPGTELRVLRTVGVRHAALEIRVRDFTDLLDLPDADLIYAGYSLPYQERPSFDRVWTMMRSALRPGGRLAVNLFGERDQWAGGPGKTFLRESEVRSLLDGLEIEHWYEEDALGPAFSGPKHWHVFHVIARRPFERGPV